MIKNIYAINVVYDNEIFNGNKQFAGMLGKRKQDPRNEY